MTVTRTHTYAEGTPPGVYTITATDGVQTAQAQITILDAQGNVVVVDPTNIAAGGTVAVTGEGFPTSTPASISIAPAGGGAPVATGSATTDADGNVPSTSVQVPASAAAGEYTVTVTVGAETGSTTLTVTAAAQLATPTGVTPGTPTDTTIPVSWTAVTNANQYLVEYRVAGTTTWSQRPPVTATTDTITGLTAGQEYDIRVTAEDTTNAFADSTPSAPVQATTTGGTPPQLSAPANVAAPTTTATSITVTWDANSDAVGYVVRYRAQGTLPWTERPQVTALTDTIPGLTGGTTYEIQVQSVGDGTNFSDSEFGPTTPITATATQQLATPTALATGTATATTMPLTWSAVTNATAYHVQYKLTSAGTWTDWTPDPTGTAVTVTGLTTATSYDFRNKAVGNGAGFTDSSYNTPVTQTTA
jgi:hypothetical protein